MKTVVPPHARLLLMRFASLAAAAFAAAALMLAASGCGGGSSSSSTTTAAATSATVTWADGMCTALVNYRAALRGARTSIRANGLSKGSVQKALDSVQAATTTFAKDISGLGKPGTAAGASAQQTVTHLTAQLKTEANAVQAVRANGTPTLSVISTIQTALSHAKSEFSTAVEQLKHVDAKGDLTNAFKQAPACATAVGS
jgi:hypothetical protein